jgi:glycosyltransferase involved in cell wall biosynthesis
MIFRIYKILKAEKPDVIHTHRYAMQYAIPAAILARVKCRVHTVHNVAEKENRKAARRLNRWFYRFAGVTPVALSELIRDTVVKEYKISEDKIPVILNGVDLSRCTPKNDYSGGSPYEILHIGRFEAQKNHQMLLSAFQAFYKKHPESRLTLIGAGPLQEACRQFVKENELMDAVRFMGLQASVHPFLTSADLFVLPSLYEGIPMTLIEAMGTGLPIVASAVGGIPDMLTDGESALLIDVTTDALEQALETAHGNADLRASLGKKALDRSVRFSSDEMAKKYIEIYIRKMHA